MLRKVPEPIRYEMTGDQARDDLAVLMVGFYSRAGDIYEAMVVLVGKKHLTEAATLARCLFEIALTARYISLEPEERMPTYKAGEGIGFHKLYRGLRKLRPADPLVKVMEENPDFGRAKKASDDPANRKQWPNRARIAEIVDQELKDRGMLADDSVESTTSYRWAYRLLYHEFSEVSHTGASHIRRSVEVSHETPTPSVAFSDPQIDDEMRYLVWSSIPFLDIVVDLVTGAVGIDMQDHIPKTG